MANVFECDVVLGEEYFDRGKWIQLDGRATRATPAGRLGFWVRPGLRSTADNFSAELQLQCLSRFQPFIFLVLCPYDRDLTHSQWLNTFRRTARAQPSDFADVHEHAFARLADEVHAFEKRPVISVFEIGPYSALRLACVYKLFWGWGLDCAAGDVGEEAGTEKDGENAEVLGGVGNGDTCVASTEGVLEAGAEVVGERHRVRVKVGSKLAVRNCAEWIIKCQSSLRLLPHPIIFVSLIPAPMHYFSQSFNYECVPIPFATCLTHTLIPVCPFLVTRGRMS